jgi:hypothetical protein
MENVPLMESLVISQPLPFNDARFPQKPGGKGLSPDFQSTYRPRITAGALLRSHSGLSVSFKSFVCWQPINDAIIIRVQMENKIFFMFACIF